MTASSSIIRRSKRRSRAGQAPPAHAGNVYDHKGHQPMENDLPAAARSGSSQQQVEKEVQDLLRQTDELDRQSEERERAAPAGRSGTR